MKGKKTRIAVIDFELCTPQKCSFSCIKACPINRTGKECIIENTETGKPNINEELCTGCGICIKKCPFKAISIVNVELNLQEPLHQFGKNGFRLYRTIEPKKGIVGLVGENGTGKTTALNVLAGKLIPNLGSYNEKASWEKVIKHFKGKEVQSFFKKIGKNEVKVSVKEQNIEGLRSSKTVKQLLEENNNAGRLEEIVRELNLQELLERNLKNLSGGELQRAAIAKTIIQNSSLYLLDEPSSFLDVKERLNAAKSIRKLASEKSVIVIEHDLAVLDYLSDLIHVFFGKPRAYGVVSSVKGVRNGINEFLNGFIKDENLKFREKELRFDVKPASTAKKTTVIAEYPAMQKTFPNFKLKAESGELMEGEVIGILGANSIGKTIFVKMLAGIEKPDFGEVPWKLKVSFKPQHVQANENITVKELFSKNINLDLFESEIKRKMQIEELFERNLKNLSGGELQRIAIALCLSRNADIYLLDEPSAFLDVEQRLRAAGTIKNVIEKRKKTGMIVEHDLLFQDFVSDRLLVFEGSPGSFGKAGKTVSMKDGMNAFLKEMQLTFRRNKESGRPRANKPDSVKDKEQKQKNQYYYVS